MREGERGRERKRERESERKREREREEQREGERERVWRVKKSPMLRQFDVNIHATAAIALSVQ